MPRTSAGNPGRPPHTVRPLGLNQHVLSRRLGIREAQHLDTVAQRLQHQAAEPVRQHVGQALLQQAVARDPPERMVVPKMPQLVLTAGGRKHQRRPAGPRDAQGVIRQCVAGVKRQDDVVRTGRGRPGGQVAYLEGAVLPARSRGDPAAPVHQLRLRLHPVKGNAMPQRPEPVHEEEPQVAAATGQVQKAHRPAPLGRQRVHDDPAELAGLPELGLPL